MENPWYFSYVHIRIKYYKKKLGKKNSRIAEI